MCSSKFSLIYINFIFCVLALVLLIIGATIQDSLNDDYGLFRGYVGIPAALLIAFGSVLFIKSLLAFLGIYYSSNRLLSVYIFALIVLIVIELSAGIAGFAVKSRVLNLITDSMRSAQSTYTNRNFLDTTWDSIQRDLKCCGVDDYSEWLEYLGNYSLPDSCCAVYRVGCGSTAIQWGNFYQSGCASAISRWAFEREVPAAIFFTFLIVFQFLSIACAGGYQRNIGRCESMLNGS